jgi:putative transposase
MAIPSRRAKPKNITAGSRTFFITSSTSGKRSLFQSRMAAELLVKVLFEYRDQGRYRLHEFVVMRDHFHALLTVGPELSIERAVQFIKGGFSFRAARELGLKGALWQKGFSEVRVLDEDGYEAHREYIYNNPVRAHMVERAEDHQFSSASAGYVLDAKPQGLKPFSFGAAVRHA